MRVADYEKFGITADLLKKVEKAVADTRNKVLIYDDNLIDATYFSCSGGMTEDAKAVWGTDIPYLQATESPGEETAAYYTDTVTLTAEELQSRLGRRFNGNPDSWFGQVTYTDGGGVDTIQICGSNYSGVELRKALGLRSTVFTITATGTVITISTKGFGHRVGMSQYGAEAMAIAGRTYEQILAHYYAGVNLVTYSTQEIDKGLVLEYNVA